MLVEQRDHAPVAAAGVADVHLRADGGGLADGLAQRAGKERVGAAAAGRGRVDTDVNAMTGVVTRSAAASITRRVGVSTRPITCSIVASAPSQCVRCVSSGPATPGKKYFEPPANPATSCGTMAPTTRM